MEKRIRFSTNEDSSRKSNGVQYSSAKNNGSVRNAKGPRKIMDPRDAKKNPKRIADPRDIKEAKTGPRRIAVNGSNGNRRASVQHVAPPNVKIITPAPQEKTRIRRQSAPALTTPLSLEDLLKDGWEPSEEDLVRLQQLTMQKLDKNRGQHNNNNHANSQNRNRRVSCIPSHNELELSTLQEEEESS